MERRKFVKNFCGIAIGMPVIAATLHACGAIYYATFSRDTNRLTVKKSEFRKIKKDKTVSRNFVLIKTETSEFPICLYKINEETYCASLMSCTHKGCELNVGGGIYSCPCHGSEFSVKGEVLEGPAEENLKTFETTTDDENIYILYA